MSCKLDKYKTKIELLFIHSLLLFAFCPISWTPWGAGWEYIQKISFPLACLTSLYILSSQQNIKFFCKNFFHFILPFLPFIITLIIVCIVHSPERNVLWINPKTLLKIIFFASYIFSIASFIKIFDKTVFFIICSSSCYLYFIDICWTAYSVNVDLLNIRNHVRPWCTIYAHCVAMTAGLSLLGSFTLDRCSKSFRYFTLSGALLGYTVSLGFLATRSVLGSVLIAIACIVWIKIKEKKKSLSTIGVLIIPIVIGISLTNLPARFNELTVELSNIPRYSQIIETIHKIENNQSITPSEAEIHSKLNSNMGARIAVWSIGTEQLIKHPWFGTGNGRPGNFYDGSKLFAYIPTALVHFHSDYVQTPVIGGLLFLFGLMATQFRLLISARRSPIKLFLIASVISFGVVDLSFLEKYTLAVFMGAWVICSLWEINNRSTTPI